MSGSIALGLTDLGRGLARLPLSNRLAWSDIKARYARSFFGPFWIALSMLSTALAISFLVTGLFGGKVEDVAPFIMIGITVYSFITQVVQESTTCLLGARPHLLGSPLPYSTFILSVVVRNLMMSAHHFPVIFVLILALGQPPTLQWLWSLAGMALVAVFVSGAALLLSVAATRFRDLAPLTAMVTGIGALMTPVYWRPETLVKNKFIAELNPVAHLLSVVRQPLIGETISMANWIWSGASAFVMLFLGVLVFLQNRKRIPFWI